MDDKCTRNSSASSPTSSKSSNLAKQISSQLNIFDQKTNSLIENIFLITINKNPQKNKQLIYLQEIADQYPQTQLINMEILEVALFERILLDRPSDFLIPNNVQTKFYDKIIESNVICYLFDCYQRVQQQLANCQSSADDTITVSNCNKINLLILRMISITIKQPDLFSNQKFQEQWYSIFNVADFTLDDPAETEIRRKFLSATFQTIYSDIDYDVTFEENLYNQFRPLLKEILMKILQSNLITLPKWILPFLLAFVSDKTNPKMAAFLLDYCTPPADCSGIDYAIISILGQLLCLSILPKNQKGPFEYYDNIQDIASTSTLTNSLWSYLKNHLDNLHLLFRAFLLIGGEVRSKMLQWFGNCLHKNVARGQLWNPHNPMNIFAPPRIVSDSFMVGLVGVLLRLCQPLFRPQFKVLLVDPTYCAVPAIDYEKRSVHMTNMEKETCLLPCGENEQRDTIDSYNFITECFFMTHKAIDLGYRVLIEKFFRMNRDLHAMQREVQQTNGANADAIEVLRKHMQKYLSIQNSIIEPFNDQLLLKFYEATAVWLIQLSTINDGSTSTTGTETSDESKSISFAPKILREIKLPLSRENIPKCLNSIPECILENIIGYLTFIRHFENQTIDSEPDIQAVIFTFILIYMGSSERVRNPHLRARLAEGLESLLPKKIQQSMFAPNFRTSLFRTHPDRLHIVSNLLNVFVGIEMTGQSVQFEQKFNYRRPMYIIMDYLWKLDEQKMSFKRLAKEAEDNINATDPPIFLRFINLLINDAIFLLDESLTNLQQIRELQNVQATGAWDSLPAAERQQNLDNLVHLGRMAKFDNILGRDTIYMLKLLTSDINEIFCHPTMVDRISAMLNHFLLKLVGPSQGNLKVKDKKEFEFDPGATVMEICQIYINLSKSETFCLAISQDSRSYSPQLFEYTEQVLVRIGGASLVTEIKEFAQKVANFDALEKRKQEILSDAPDEFLDPIMSTLMTDPVILPSSHVTVDRTTIARHFLSDQTDPFNRSPLTMDQIRPDVELKIKIDNWIQERRTSFLQNSNNNNNNN